MTVTDPATGTSLSLKPARLYHYKHDFGQGDVPAIQGLAALDDDGLVLLDLPGDWHTPHLESFTHRAGIPVEDARRHPSDKVRAVLACRAPGWQRIRGLPSPGRWRKGTAIAAAIAGAALMVYLASVGLWVAWRGLSMFGRLILDLLETKWLLVAFSPALLVFGPVRSKYHRLRRKRGLAIGPFGGPNLTLGPSNVLHITLGNKVVAKVRLGTRPGQGFGLLLYRYENLTGLFIQDVSGRALHHLPGPWSPEEVEHFAKRHDLRLAVHQVSREEYLNLAKSSQEAIP
ncbi:hypothetical protein [Nonomuraea insulae]|uniref:Uncharacterized protein n=1 Tax=Nonomuraea insulae TaxID=1616787 RepID=A0ABW1D737_9ACTN